MKPHYISVLFIAILSFTFSIDSFSQAKGNISGKIVDSKTGEELIGASVGVKGTSSGAQADLDGKYFLSLAPGVYDLQVVYISYKTKDIKAVEVKSGETTFLNISLDEDVNELQEVVIESDAGVRKESEAVLLIQQKNAVAMSSGISAELIRKMPDRTTADVIKRVSGASVQDGKFAVIRGLGDRYNTAFINGAPLPSTESDKKAFALDIVPAQVLDNMTITKTATPDMPGDFAGGFIQINTKDIPDENTRFVSIGASSHSLTTFKPYVNSPAASGTDFLSYDNGPRTLPSGTLSTDQANQLVSTNVGNTEADKTLVSQTNLFNNKFVQSPISSARPNLSLQFGGSQRFKVASNDMGVVFAFTYNNSLKFTPFTNNSPSLTPGVKDPNAASQNVKYVLDGQTDTTTRTQGSFYNYDSYRNNVLIGSILNLSYKLGQSGKLSFKNFFTSNSDDQIQIRNGYFLNPNSGDEVRSDIDRAYYYQQSRMYSSQFLGEHVFGSRNIKLKYTIGYTNIGRDIPDYKRLFYQSRRGSGNTNFDQSGAVFQPAASSTFTPSSSGRFYAKLNENSYSGSYDLTIPFAFLGKTEVKIGGFHHYRSRDFTARNYLFYYNDGDLGSYLTQFQSVDTLFNSKNIDTKTGIFQRETTQQSDKYTASSFLNAGFLMLDNRFNTWLRLIWGVRLESFNQQLNSSNSTGPVTVNTTVVDPLPSANFIIKLSEKANLRFGYSRTVSRPEFREFAPLAFYEFASNAIITGNSSLVRGTINNFDLKYEIYPQPGQFFSINPFFKHFTTPVEIQALPGQSGLRSFNYTNAPSAINYGVELEGRYSLKALDALLKTSFLKNVNLFANYTWLNSSVDVSQFNPKPDYSSRPLQGQSPYVFNGGIQYMDDVRNFDVTLTVNRIGRRIAYTGNRTVDIIWENPRTVLDFSVSKTFFKKLQAKFIIGDLLAQPLTFYYDLDFDNSVKQQNIPYPFGDVSYDSSKHIKAFEYRNGMTTSLSLTYNF